MEYPLKRAAKTSFYYAAPYAKRARSYATTYVKNKISTGIKNAIERRIEGRIVRPSDVRKIVNRQIIAATDMRFFGEEQPMLSSKRSFTSQLLCSRIVQGVTSQNRTGDKIHLREFTCKGVFNHTGVTGINPTFSIKSVLAAPVYLHMFLIKTNRSDDPQTYWFKNTTADGDASFSDPENVGSAQTTALSDQNRIRSRFNTDDYTILKYNKIQASSVMCQGDNFGDSCREYTFTYKWTNSPMIQFNNAASATIPWAAPDLSARYYFVTYLSQPDDIADDNISVARWRSTCYTYFNDN
jgi:hypothetical protein